jgi:hypothetical protein
MPSAKQFSEFSECLDETPNALTCGAQVRSGTLADEVTFALRRRLGPVHGPRGATAP